MLDLALRPPGPVDSLIDCVASLYRALGDEVDRVAVAGTTGLAFVVPAEAGEPGFDWNILREGIAALGREVEFAVADYEPAHDGRLPVELAEPLAGRVTVELAGGRACILRGAGPGYGFGIVYGVRRGAYLVRTARGAGASRPLGPDESPEPAVHPVQIHAAGCLVALFPGDPAPRPGHRARGAVARAARMLAGEHPGLAPGPVSFEELAGRLRSANRLADDVRSQLALARDRQHSASAFLERLAVEEPEAADSLRAAAASFGQAAAALGGLAGTAEPAAVLARCAELNRHALAALRRALAEL